MHTGFILKTKLSVAELKLLVVQLKPLVVQLKVLFELLSPYYKSKLLDLLKFYSALESISNYHLKDRITDNVR